MSTSGDSNTFEIQFSDSTKPSIVINRGQKDNSTSIELFGFDSADYGESLNRNLLRMLENFASPQSPANPIDGQIWVDTSDDPPIPMVFSSGAGWTRISREAGSDVIVTNANIDQFAPTFTGGGATGIWGIGISGNAATATALQTTRSINGTGFNGSTNITTANWGTARNITIGNTTRSVNGSANVGWTVGEIGAAPVSHTHSGSEIISGIIAPARLGSGTPSSQTVLRGDGTWGPSPSSGLRLIPRVNVFSGTQTGTVTVPLPSSLFENNVPTFVMFSATAQLTGVTDLRSFWVVSGAAFNIDNIVLGTSSDDTDQNGTATVHTSNTFVLPYAAVQQFTINLSRGAGTYQGLRINVIGYQV